MRLDADRLDTFSGDGRQPRPERDRILVAINEASVARTLVRAGYQTAQQQGAPWTVVRVITPKSETLPEGAKNAVAEAEQLAQSLGGEVITLNVERGVARTIVDYARTRGVGRIIIGQARPQRLLSRLAGRGVGAELTRLGRDFELVFVPGEEDQRPEPIRRPRLLPRTLRVYLVSVLAVTAATAVAYAVTLTLPGASRWMVFLVAIVAVAARYGLWPSVFASILSFFVLDFLFIQPLYSFGIANTDIFLNLGLYFLASIITGNLAYRLRAQVSVQREIARRTAKLYEYSRVIAGTTTLQGVVRVSVKHIAADLQCRLILLLPDADGALAVAGSHPAGETLGADDRAAADWSWEHGEPAGCCSGTMPGVRWLFLPLKTHQDRQGVLGIALDRGKTLDAADRRLLDALVDQIAIVIDRTRLAADVEEARLKTEEERLRSALLSSVSHDLRTPLVSIIGSAGALLEPETPLGTAAQRQLIETIHGEGRRLNRYIQNLLDMTRIAYGALKPRQDWIDPRELIGRAIHRVQPDLDGRAVRVGAMPGLPTFRGDATLLEQVLVNVLDNAVKHAPAGTAIEVEVKHDATALSVAISDEGPGIPVADRERVFDMFYRVQAADHHGAGTGLGLAIARAIVEAHRGSISVAAAGKGRGARIEIRLPLEPEPEAAPALAGA